MSKNDRRDKETPGVEAPGPLDRALDRDRDDKADILEGGADRKGTHAAGERRDFGAVQEDEIRVPVAEERLNVGKREVELGEVEVRKTVETEEQTVPVTLTHDEVQIREERVNERAATGDDLFKEGTIRVPVRGEEAVVAKETVVTGEMVIEKDAVAEERQITDTVRKQRVEIDEAYKQARSDFQQSHNTRGTKRSFEETEPHYRAGFSAAHDERFANREFDDAEPELRSEYERTNTKRTGSGDNWEQLREDIREGWQKARNR
jgi:uncharacterized protein (TIGR02271 family)